MADIDELERLLAAADMAGLEAREDGFGTCELHTRADMPPVASDVNAYAAHAIVALVNAAPALIAAARAAQHRGETMGRVAEAVGYPRDAHYGDVLGRIDEIVAERDRLRAAVDGVLADVARWREHEEAHVGTGGEIGQLSHSTAAYLERVLRAAGGWT